MKAAVVYELGKSPAYRDFDDPMPQDDEVRVAVTASALTNFTKLRAAGKHYSFSAQPPFIPGIDGVGRLDDGTRVYFLFPRAPFGGMAESTVCRHSALIPVPHGVDDLTLAAIADPGMSAWAGLQERAKLLPGETVMVNGATGTAGGLAVQIAKHLGAGKIIATGRNAATLESLQALGADETINLTDQTHLDQRLHDIFARGVDVVLDYLWGPSAEALLTAATARTTDQPVRFIQIGTTSAPTITLPGRPLHSAAIEIKGSGVGSVHPTAIAQILRDLITAAHATKFQVATRPIPLEHVESAWSIEKATPRTVLTIDAH